MHTLFGAAGQKESMDRIPFLAAGLIVSAILEVVAGFARARRGYRLVRDSV